MQIVFRNPSNWITGASSLILSDASLQLNVTPARSSALTVDPGPLARRRRLIPLLSVSSHYSNRAVDHGQTRKTQTLRFRVLCVLRGCRGRHNRAWRGKGPGGIPCACGCRESSAVAVATILPAKLNSWNMCYRKY